MVKFELLDQGANQPMVGSFGDFRAGRSGQVQRQIELVVPRGLATTGDGTLSFTVEVVDNAMADWDRSCQLGGSSPRAGTRFLSSGVASLEVPGDLVGRLQVSLRFADPSSGQVLVGHFGIPVRRYGDTGIHVQTKSADVSEHSVIFQPIEVNEVASGALEIFEGDTRVKVRMVEEQLYPSVLLRQWLRREKLTILPDRGDGVVRAVGLHLGPTAVVGRCYCHQLHSAARRRLREAGEKRVHWVTSWDEPRVNQLIAQLRYLPGEDEAQLEVTNLSDYSRSPSRLELRGGGWGDERLDPGATRSARLSADTILGLAAERDLLQCRVEDVRVGELACPVLTTEGTGFPFPPTVGEGQQQVRLLAIWIPMRENNLEQALALTDSSLHLRFAGDDFHLALRFDAARGGVTLGANHPMAEC